MLFLGRTSALRLHCAASLLSRRALQIRVRPAVKEDIPLIDQCNRANLPENYTPDFYDNHLRKWADLSFVAETEGAELVGYALGQIVREEYNLFSSLDQPLQLSGHIFSVAVSSSCRGRGVAKLLVETLHRQFATVYEVDSVTLNCRVSNEAAIKLYCNVFKYSFKQRRSGYYVDGEDGWSMELAGLLQAHQHSSK